ncbi:MAG: hypothetical protein V4629_09330 [Pseudomonadota bacterium]
MSRKMVFVVGAGASKEINLPVDNELKNVISEMLNIKYDDWGRNQVTGDHAVCQTLHHYTKNPDGTRGGVNPLLHEAWYINLSLI